MNTVELQLDFYRRFNDAASYLTISQSGLLCSLLGHAALNGSRSLNCTLSMGVRAALRRLDSGTIKVENTQHNTCAIYDIRNAFTGNSRQEAKIRQIFNKTGFNGAEVLYDTDIPKGYNYEPSLRCAVLKGLYTINNSDLPDARDAAYLCGNGKNLMYYTSLFSSKPGWCSYIDTNKSGHLPLPLGSMYIILARGRKRGNTLAKNNIKREFEALKRIHPIVFTYSDIDEYMTDSDNFRYLKHIAGENKRIEQACKELRYCQISKFAEIVNESQKSIERHLHPSDEQTALAHYFRECSGCLCARAWENSVYAIVESKLADYIIKKIRDSFTDKFGYPPQLAVTKCI